MKVIPVYLPQFHTIPENDQWWGKGFTEWTNVKKAEPLFPGHYQPRVPANKNYYDLSRLETLKWQAELAREHGIYGFCMYHYWFNGHLLLEKPMEMLLAHPEIDLKYCISWANHDWTDAWKASNRGANVLIAHDFDDENDWIRHFEYMLPFLKDPRYMSENNKPYMVIYAPNLIKKIGKMVELWNQLAIATGFSGLTFIYQSAASCFDTGWDRTMFDYGVQFHPGYANMSRKKSFYKAYWQLVRICHSIKNKIGIKRSVLGFTPREVSTFDYDETWRRILSLSPENNGRTIPSAFVDWDNTPRCQNRGSVCIGASPEKFEKYFRELVSLAKNVYHSDKIFVFAWNEWAEGGYLEPDETYGTGYLQAIKNVLEEIVS